MIKKRPEANNGDAQVWKRYPESNSDFGLERAGCFIVFCGILTDFQWNCIDVVLTRVLMLFRQCDVKCVPGIRVVVPDAGNGPL
jgi:hypothetical protein